MSSDFAKSKFTKSERALLRQLASEAWDAELREALLGLYENFGTWADNGMSSFDLTDRIHEFHNGTARDLYKRYTGVDPGFLVSRAIALGVLGEDAVEAKLLSKLAEEIEFIRKKMR
jgi:hypothetical protein